MRIGGLSKFNRKKNLWISRKHPLYLETTEFKTLYSAAILMHTRLNNQRNPLNNLEFERLITKGLGLTSKETITIMNLSKEVEQLVDNIILALNTKNKQLFFFFDLYNMSMAEYHISPNEQRSLDLFSDLLNLTSQEKTWIFQFVTSAYCKEYENCINLFQQMKNAQWPITMTDLSYYMLEYSYIDNISNSDIKPNDVHYFRGDCEFHGTIIIPQNTTIHISNAIVNVEGNFLLDGGTLHIENSSIDFSNKSNTDNTSYAFINSKNAGTVLIKNSSIQCSHNGGLLSLSNSNSTIEYCQISNTSKNSAIVSNTGSLFVKDTSFSNCFSLHKGGAIYIKNGTGQIKNCSFFDCQAHEGGGIYANHNTIVSGCYFENCFAVNFGGGIFYNGEIRANIENCKYSNCFPKNNVIIQYIHPNNDDYLINNETNITYSTIFDCHVKIKEFGILTISNASIYLKHTILCHGIINMNKTHIYGYDIEDRDLIQLETPKSCHFNQCEFDGMQKCGIFRAVRARLRIINCVFKNTANGRAIYNAFSPTIDGCVFSYCQEGALYANAGKITNCTFINCRARSGAGIIMYGSKGQIEHCHFQRCISEYSGGAIDISGSYHVVGCTYLECKPNNF
ncbi:MAG: right-handed parallel beta-helix repeat-containing protein [Lachnospiraceae bacterium]|nr:right-handed parallel beta-helix repeat-containing protein [Lachnospiraceae bacterium]